MSEEHVDYIAETEEAMQLLRGPIVEMGSTKKEIFATTEPGKYVAVEGGPWIKLHTSFRNRLLAELQGAKLSVFLCLGLHVDDRGECFPSIATIAAETGFSEREISSTIKELDGMGLIAIVPNPGRSNVYVLNGMVSYGPGNPMGDEVIAVVKPTSGVGVKPTSPISRTNKEEPVYTAAPKNSAGETECSIPAGMNERTAKALKFDCTFCGTKEAIGWSNVLCPVEGCGATIRWQGNKWLDKILKQQQADAKAAAKRTAQQERMKQNPALAHFMITFPDVYIDHDDEKAITDFVARVDLQTFKDKVQALYAADLENRMAPQGIARHVINSLPYWGKQTDPGQKRDKEIPFLPLT